MFRIAFFFIWLTIFTFPWQNLVITGFGTISRIVGVLSIVFSFLYILLSGKIKKIKFYYGFIFLFIIWVGISYFWSANPTASYVYFSQLVQLFVLIWMLYEFSNTEKSYYSLLFAYVLGCFISSGNTVYNYLTSTDIYANRWVADGFNANYLAYTLTLALPIAWYLYKNGYRPKLNLLYIPIGIYSTVLTGSRTAFIGLVIFLMFLCWQFIKKKFRYKKRIIFLFLLLSPYLYSKIPTQSINRLMTITSELTTGDLNNRSYIWNYAIGTLREVNVFFGGGAGSFPISAHNVYLGLIVELGIIGLLFYAGIILINAGMVKRMNNDDKWLWTLMLSMWFIYSNMATIENEKMTWFIFGMIPVCYYLRNRDFKRKNKYSLGRTRKKLRGKWGHRKCPY